MSHVLRDGDNIMLGSRLPGGHEITCIIYIDHNLGTLVKDSFVVPASIASMVAEFRRVTEDPDGPARRWNRIPTAAMGSTESRSAHGSVLWLGIRSPAR